MIILERTNPTYIAKSGCGPENCVELASFISKNCEALKLKGLMTIGSPWNAEETAINPDFKVFSHLL